MKIVVLLGVVLILLFVFSSLVWAIEPSEVCGSNAYFDGTKCRFKLDPINSWGSPSSSVIQARCHSGFTIPCEGAMGKYKSGCVGTTWYDYSGQTMSIYNAYYNPSTGKCEYYADASYYCQAIKIPNDPRCTNYKSQASISFEYSYEYPSRYYYSERPYAYNSYNTYNDYSTNTYNYNSFNEYGGYYGSYPRYYSTYSSPYSSSYYYSSYYSYSRYYPYYTPYYGYYYTSYPYPYYPNRYYGGYGSGVVSWYSN